VSQNACLKINELAKYIYLLVTGLGLVDGWTRISVLIGVELFRPDWLLKAKICHKLYVLKIEIVTWKILTS
jgi:hypothetical protein